MGHVDVLEVLVKYGADVNAKHKFAGSTALHFASEMGQVKAISFLCRHGANVEAAKIQGGTPLHIAADSNQTDVARVLVSDCKAKTDSLLMGDTTPLYLAAQKASCRLRFSTHDANRALLKLSKSCSLVVQTKTLRCQLALLVVP